MITRIVKLHIAPEHVNTFRKFFEEAKAGIKSMKGCERVELFHDLHQPNILFTYSNWNSADDLENYRKSDFFENTWSKVKPLFIGKPEAWSLQSFE